MLGSLLRRDVFIVYREINPTLATPVIYTQKLPINEFHRLEFTEFRVSGHALTIETGLWNRRGRGRLPVEKRLCGCGSIQAERHVVEQCVLSQHVRQAYAYLTLEDLFENVNNDTICKVIYDILSVYK